MESRVLASVVCSLVSQALVLVLLLSPVPPTTAASNLPSLLPLLLHLLSPSSQLAAASAGPLLPRKRKRQQTPDSQSGGDESEESGRSLVVTGEETPPQIPPIHHNPDHFRLSFRMTSSTFEWLSGLLEPLLDCHTPPAVGSPSLRLPAPTRLAIGLCRLATGSPYPDLARRFGVPEPTARFCVRRLCRVLCTNFRFWLAFPSPSALQSVSSGFEAVGKRLPNCCGAVACTHFEVGGGDTVVAQLVTDASSRILNIATGFRGDKAGSRVLRRSSLFKDIEAGQLLSLSSSQYLIGGRGYPLLPWLMVPFADPADGSSEEGFNEMHGKMLRPVLRTVSSLRNWGILSCPMDDEEIKMAVACIGTCSILHNVLLMREDYSALSDEADFFRAGDKSSGDYYPEEVSLEEHPIETEAFVLRNRLADRTREIHYSGMLCAEEC